MRCTGLLRSAMTLLAAGMFASGVAAAPTNLIENGGFESGLDGWTVSGFFLEGFDYGIDNEAHGGSNAFYGGAIDSLGFLSQNIATQPGETYRLRLWLLTDGFLPNRFQVLVDGNLAVDLEDLMIPASYAPVGVSFLATNLFTAISFGFRNDAGYLHADDISVTQALPEPSTVALLGMAVGMVLLRGRSARGSMPR